jgi:hypothetical protein
VDACGALRCRCAYRPQPAVRGKRKEPIREITISSQLGEHAARHPIPDSHISNIGTIRHALDDLAGEVYDYPDDETYETDGADYPDGYGELAWPADRRWRPVTAIAGAVVATCAIAAAVILNSGDSATTKGTVRVPTPTPRTVMTTPSTQPSAPRTTAPPSASPSLTPRTPQLPPETVTTVTPTPSIGPTRTPTAAPPTGLPRGAVPPQATLNPRTVVYSVTGTKQLLDLVTVVYTDAQGYPHTELNVALPWTKAVVLNPGVQTQSVIATSIYSRLDCSIVNAAGQPVVASANNTMIATCTR